MFLNIERFQGKGTSQERQDRCQRVLDELTELEPEQWPARVDRAVEAGELRADDREFVLRVAGQVEKLRVMIVPSQIRWPETELIGFTPRTFASEMIGRSPGFQERVMAAPSGADSGESVGIHIHTDGVDPDLLAAFSGEPWPSIAWLRPELPAAAGQPRIGSREALRARRLKRSGRPEPSRRPVRPQ